MSGKDAFRGFGYQIAYTLSRLLELLDEKTHVERVVVEGINDDIEDLTIVYNDGSQEVVQVKKRETGDELSGYWNKAAIRDHIARLHRLSELKDRRIVAFKFIATGNCSPEVIDIQRACDGIRRGSPSPAQSDTLSTVRGMIGAAVSETQDFMSRLSLIVPAPDEEQCRTGVQHCLMKDHGVPGDEVERTYGYLFWQVFERGERRGPDPGSITSEELKGWIIKGRSGPILAEETLPDARDSEPLYDRERNFGDAQEVLLTSRRVWLSGRHHRGRTRLANRLAWQCLDDGQFVDCIGYSPDRKGTSPSYGTYLLGEFIKPKSSWKLGKDKILLVIDDFDEFRDSEKSEIVEFLDQHLPLGCKAVVIGQPTDHQLFPQRSWHWISVQEQLGSDDVEKFVCAYATDHRPWAQRVLDDVGEEQWRDDLPDVTNGCVERLLIVLYSMKSDGYGKAVDWLRSHPAEDGTMEAWVMEIMATLSPDHQRLLTALSFFKTSASTEMLEKVVGCSQDELTRLLQDPVIRPLIEVITTDDGARRYQLAAEKGCYITRQCEQSEDLLLQFTDWWRGYAYVNGRRNYKRYPMLSAEHKNLTGALDQLWRLVGVQVPQGYDSEDGEAPPPDTFPRIAPFVGEKAAEQFIEIRDYLRDYLEYGGRWLDYRCSAKRAYALACALGHMDKASQAACDVAYTYSLEGWCGPSLLRVAEGWIVRMEESICVGRFRGEFEQKSLAQAFRMRGLLAMRRSDLSTYVESRGYFERALSALEGLGSIDREVARETRQLYSLLARLEMRYNPIIPDGCAGALKYFEKAIGSAVEYGDREDQAVFKTNRAEMRVWSGDWISAVGDLEEALPVADCLGWEGLQAENLYLQAFVYQGESERENDIDKLGIAIGKAETALDIFRAMPECKYFLNLCGTYLLLSGLYLYRCKQWVSGDNGDDERRSQDYLEHAREFLEMHKILCPDAAETNKQRPNADTFYVAIVQRAMSKDFDDMDEFFSTALQIQPGLRSCMLNDFRLRRPVVELPLKYEEYLSGTCPIIIGGGKT